jgi:hypothetical protein
MKIRWLFILLLCGYIVTSQANAASNEIIDSSIEDPVFSLHKYGYGWDSSYVVEVYSNLYVHFKGLGYVRTNGDVTYKITMDQYNRLQRFLDQTNFSEIRNALKSTYIPGHINATVTVNSLRKKEQHDFLWSKEYIQFIDSIDGILGLELMKCPYYEYKSEIDNCVLVRERDAEVFKRIEKRKANLKNQVQ